MTSIVLKLKGLKEYNETSLMNTTTLLRLNPEFSTVWNYRKTIISNLRNKLDNAFWNVELAFTMEQLKIFPKTYCIWNHRVWCLTYYSDTPLKIWNHELKIVEDLLKMDSRNFHGWHYRRFIISNISKFSDEMLEMTEFDFTTSMINKNISNYSAWHQRSKLIPQMFSTNQIKDKEKFILDEMDYIINAMFTDSEDQSVWFYVKWFIKDASIMDHLDHKKYTFLLTRLYDSISVINEDELSFSNKDNIWCLKTLIVIESIQKDLKVNIESHSAKFLRRLIIADPLRKNRYLYLLNNVD